MKRNKTKFGSVPCIRPVRNLAKDSTPCEWALSRSRSSKGFEEMSQLFSEVQWPSESGNTVNLSVNDVSQVQEEGWQKRVGTIGDVEVFQGLETTE